MAQKKAAPEERQKPAFERRLGSIRVAVWSNQKENGEVWYKTTITRSYHDGNTWQDTTGYSRDDLPVVIAAAGMAYSWMWEQVAVAREERETEA